MADPAPSLPADGPLRLLVRLVLRLFFREVEVLGLERLPGEGPLILVSNHVNGLIDPLLLIGPLPRTPRFLAKSTLWKNPVIRPLLGLAGAIPVYRRQDQGTDPSKNLEAFERCYEILGKGGAIALFPEGKSHSEPQLQPLKTGAARIALETVRRFPGCGLQVVPVGLLFDAKQAFRSRALVEVGEGVDPEGGVEALTDRIDDALRDVTLNYETWEEARILGRSADLYRTGHPELPGKGTLAAGVEVRRAALERYRTLRQESPEKVEAAVEAVRRYDDLLRACRLRDDQVGAAYPPSPVLRFVATTLLRLVVLLPLALLGTVLNYPVYRLIGVLVPRLTRDPDQGATYKVFGALLFFPLFWIALAFLGWRFLPGSARWAALALPLLAPFLGALALRFHDRRVRFLNEARAFLLLKSRKRLAEELRERRAEVMRWVEDLAG
jgi:glycerol-3-phosphate O-acyltransferase/dihydroxyacetone phosphate acyltransferase